MKKLGILVSLKTVSSKQVLLWAQNLHFSDTNVLKVFTEGLVHLSFLA